VPTPDEVQAALRNITRLADQVGAPFRRALQVLGDGALTGPAAATLDRGMAERHQRVQRSFTSAFDQVSRLAPPAGIPPPRIGGPPSAGRVSGGDVRAGDPRKLEVLAGELRRTGRALEDAGQALGSITARVGLGAGSGRSVGEAGSWAVSQAADVRRRGEDLRRADAGVAGALGAVARIMAAALGGPPAPGQVSELLAKARSGDTGALAQLAMLQQSYADSGLAKRIAAWWKSLTADERERLIQAVPGQVGALDGLPAAVRDRANRAFLGQQKQMLAEELAELKADPKANEKAIGDLTGKLKGITDVEKRLARGGKDGMPPMFLLGFDTNNLGHVAVSVGNPDTADNVVTFVPGFSTKLASAGGNIDRAITVWDQAHRFDPHHSTASIFWLGYDAPQGVGDVATADLAEAGATRLDSFLQGLHAARNAPAPAHSTLLGHSYGSLVSGKAAVHYGGPIADDIAFVGSPGVGVDEASQLGMPAGHVWAGRSPDDPVPFVPPLPTPFRPDKWVDDHSVRYGNDPTSSEFGGKRFTVDHEAMLHAHSSYWDPQSKSLLNIARIVNGQYGDVNLIHPPHPTPNPQPAAAPTAPTPQVQTPTPQATPSPAPGP
jgi:hypothetical protein